MPETPDLAAAARSHSVGIVGGGIAGLIVAWECAKVGMTVTVWDAHAAGGLARREAIAGTAVDIAADSIETGGIVDDVLDAFGLAASLQPAVTTSRWLMGAKPVALPDSPALGIPANPFAADVTALIGWGGVWRAYLDRVKPVLTIGNAEYLGPLVAQRMGAKVRDKLVAPRTRAELRLEPDDVVVDAALAELNGALTRAGSLSGGVGLLEHQAKPQRPQDGVGALIEALTHRITELGGTIVEHARVSAIRAKDKGWTISVATTVAERDDVAEPSPASQTESLVNHLVIATDESSAHSLLKPHAPSLAADTSVAQTVVTLAITGIDATRGAGLYAEHASGEVQRIDHVSAQWPTMSRPAGAEIVRVTLAGHHDDADAAQRAEAAVAKAYGSAGEILGTHVERIARARSRAARGWTTHVDGIRGQVASLSQLDVVGAWVAGDSMRAVIEDATATAEAIRRQALFPV